MNDQQLDILIVLAHPDDEALSQTGLILHAHSHGLRCGLICATRGELGEIRDARLGSPEILGAVRTAELQRAMKLVELDWLELLPYRDSGMAGTPGNDDPRALVQAHRDEVVAHVVRAIRLMRPTSIVTFGPDGVYGHPDHVFIGQIADIAFDRAAHGWPSLGAPWQPTSLYHMAVPRERVLLSMKHPKSPFHQMPRDMAMNFGTPARAITHLLDVSAWIERKLAIVLTHATQISPDNPLVDRESEEARRWLGAEHWSLVRTAESPGDDRPDPVDDLCARYPGRPLIAPDSAAL